MNIKTELKAIGFEITNTGGGCMAYTKTITPMVRILVTRADKMGLPTIGGTISIGVLKEGFGDCGYFEEEIAEFNTKSVKQAVAWIKKQKG